MPQRSQRPHIIVVSCALAALSLLSLSDIWPRQPDVRKQVLHSEATAWMADALPGVGVKTRESVAQAIREWRLESLRKETKQAVLKYFYCPGD